MTDHVVIDARIIEAGDATRGALLAQPGNLVIDYGPGRTRGEAMAILWDHTAWETLTILKRDTLNSTPENWGQFIDDALRELDGLPYEIPRFCGVCDDPDIKCDDCGWLSDSYPKYLVSYTHPHRRYLPDQAGVLCGSCLAARHAQDI